jgi:hypothetical protein
MRPTAVDDMFADQLTALRDAGFSASVCPDSVIQQGKSLRDVPVGATVVYRGWMLNAIQYSRLAEAIVLASATPITPPGSYLATHHLPNWYPLITEFTPETRVLPVNADLPAELRALRWDGFFIKDYVKSLKTSRGSIIRDPSEIAAVVAEMEQFRGEIEGGLCVRRVEPFVADTERRYFVLDGTPYSATGEPPPGMVDRIVPRISSAFFSVDVIRREDGAERIVEIGDGQVSDLVGWTANAFAAMWVARRRIA